MQIFGKRYKFPFVILFLQTLAAWDPAAAQEEQAPDEAYFRLVVATCYTCHSASGGGGAIPPLEGLSGPHIKGLLTAYKTGREQATIMNRISKALTDAEIDRISAVLGREGR